MKYLHDVPAIKAGLEFLTTHDPVFSGRDIDINKFEWPYMGAGFSGLVRIVCGQQVSTKAADAIWGRVLNAVPSISPEHIMALSDEALRALGLSRQKVSYIRGLAEVILDERFDLDALKTMDDSEVAEAITRLKGFGRWSAEIYLMFCLARPDVWPAGDLGVQIGLQIYRDAEDRPDEAMTRAEGEGFKPYRTAAALLLWHLKSQN